MTDNTCGPHPPQESLAQEVRRLQQHAMEHFLYIDVVPECAVMLLAEALEG